MRGCIGLLGLALVACSSGSGATNGSATVSIDGGPGFAVAEAIWVVPYNQLVLSSTGCTCAAIQSVAPHTVYSDSTQLQLGFGPLTDFPDAGPELGQFTIGAPAPVGGSQASWGLSYVPGTPTCEVGSFAAGRSGTVTLTSTGARIEGSFDAQAAWVGPDAGGSAQLTGSFSAVRCDFPKPAVSDPVDQCTAAPASCEAN